MKCIECGVKIEECVCVTDPLFEDEEASDYINFEEAAKRVLTNHFDTFERLAKSEAEDKLKEKKKSK